MSKVDCYPERLREFAAQLQQFNSDGNELIKALNAHFEALSEEWRDQEHQKFQEVYHEFSAQLTKFLDATDNYVPYLNRKAEHLENYLNSGGLI